MGHAPVLLNEVTQNLAAQDGDVILDGTFGGGGYTRAILASASCTVLGVDRDLDAIVRAEKLAETLVGLEPLLGQFGDMDVLAETAGYPSVNGVVLDLGVSSFQIDQAERGFSFMRDGPLDMRMGAAGPSAADVVAHMAERDLANLIYQLGEDKQSRRIAKAIVDRRKTAPFTTTLDLANLIEEAVGGRKGSRTHPATKAFQAIRMYVNDELGELARGLSAAERILAPGGRLVVVTFHSLEDRLVKQFLRTRSGTTGGGSRHVPISAKGPEASFTLISRKAIDPTLDEIKTNPRSRSARLRAAIRTDAPAWDAARQAMPNIPPLSTLEAAL